MPSRSILFLKTRGLPAFWSLRGPRVGHSELPSNKATAALLGSPPGPHRRCRPKAAGAKPLSIGTFCTGCGGSCCLHARFWRAVCPGRKLRTKRLRPLHYLAMRTINPQDKSTRTSTISTPLRFPVIPVNLHNRLPGSEFGSRCLGHHTLHIAALHTFLESKPHTSKESPSASKAAASSFPSRTPSRILDRTGSGDVWSLDVRGGGGRRGLRGSMKRFT